MEKQYRLHFGGGLDTKTYDQAKFSALDNWIAVKNNSDELWTYYPIHALSKIVEVEKVEPVYVREPGISLDQRRMA